MLGGVDIEIAMSSHVPWQESLDSILRATRLLWNDAVVQCADTAQSWPIGAPDLPYDTLREVFIYKNDQFRTKWEELGAVPENENSMVHVLPGGEELTVVVDSPAHPEMKRLLELFRGALENLGIKAAVSSVAA